MGYNYLVLFIKAPNPLGILPLLSVNGVILKCVQCA